MLRGELYVADDPDLEADLARAQRLLDEYNGRPRPTSARAREILVELFGEVGPGVVVRSPFLCEYGTRVTIGAGTFVNFDCVMLDVAPITIGKHCQIATRVALLTAGHPVEPQARREGWEWGAPIALGDNVWLGGGTIVCPGVSIGEDTVVGAGAVVTRDLPAGVVAAGSPARVLRAVDEPRR